MIVKAQKHKRFSTVALLADGRLVNNTIDAVDAAEAVKIMKESYGTEEGLKVVECMVYPRSYVFLSIDQELSDEIRRRIKIDPEDYAEELRKSGQAQCALEMLGLPDLSDPNFDAQVTHAAFRLGLLVPKPPKE